MIVNSCSTAAQYTLKCLAKVAVEVSVHSGVETTVDVAKPRDECDHFRRDCAAAAERQDDVEEEERQP